VAGVCGGLGVSDLRDGGKFALGVMVGIAFTNLFQILDSLWLDMSTVGKELKWDLLLLFIGASLPFVYGIWQSERDNRRRSSEWVTLMTSYEMNDYHNSPEEIKKIADFCSKNENILKKFPLRKYCESWQADVVDQLSESSYDWKLVKKYKNYLKVAAIGSLSGLVPRESIEIVVRRGEADFFFHIWALTVHKYYAVRSSIEKQSELGPGSFDSEVQVFVELEKYLDCTRRSRRGGFLMSARA
jgi:hypothetical protein